MSEADAELIGVRHPRSGRVHREQAPGRLYCSRGYATDGYSRVVVDEVPAWSLCRNCWPTLYRDPLPSGC